MGPLIVGRSWYDIDIALLVSRTVEQCPGEDLRVMSYLDLAKPRAPATLSGTGHNGKSAGLQI